MSELVNMDYREVGGWLMFLCFSLVVIAPLFTAWTIWRELVHLPLTDEWLVNGIRLSLYGVQVAIVVFGLIAGVFLWRLHRQGRRLVKLYLLMHFLAAVGITVFLTGLGSLSGSGGLIWEALWPGLARAAVFCGAWWLYLARSFRVKRTYELKFATNADSKSDRVARHLLG